MRRALSAALTIVLLAGCDDRATDPEMRPSAEMCPEVITAQVVIAPDAAPEFRWSPQCRISHLSVTTAERDQVMWYLSSQSAGFASGVGYGSPPVGAIQGVPAVPLVVGETYLLSLGTVVGGDAVFVHATKAFTR